MKVTLADPLGLGTWNHRVIARTRGERYLAIHEVHYAEDGTARGWSADPVPVVGDTLAEQQQTLLRMLGALAKPVLVEDGDALVHEKTGKPATNIPLSHLAPEQLSVLLALHASLDELFGLDK